MGRLLERISQKYRDRKLIVEIFIFLSLVRLGLRFIAFPRLQKYLEKVSQLSPNTSERLSVGKIVWAVEASSRYMPGGIKCLARALTTHTLMKQHGHVGELRIGVAKGETGELEAHAWVEHRDRIVIGYLKDLARYIPMPSFQGSRL